MISPGPYIQPGPSNQLGTGSVHALGANSVKLKLKGDHTWPQILRVDGIDYRNPVDRPVRGVYPGSAGGDMSCVEYLV